MSEDNEKMISLTLGDETGAIPTSIKQLAISLDKYLADSDIKQKERHEELKRLLNDYKKQTTDHCENCKKEVDANFKSLEIITFFIKNPKVLWFGVSILILVLFLAGVGSNDMIQNFSNVIKFVK